MLDSHALIIMGVSGCGKTTVSQALAKCLTCPVDILDGDDFHSAENIFRMRHGHALTDVDRLPWLLAQAHALRVWWEQYKANGRLLILACSALKQEYRTALRVLPAVNQSFVYLFGSAAMLRQRLRERDALGKHFMPSTMLASQLNALEPPNAVIEPDTFAVDLNCARSLQAKSLAQLVGEICSTHPWLKGKTPLV